MSAGASSNPHTARKLAEITIALRWRDLDAFNHVNNSTFLTYTEELRLHWMSAIEGAMGTATTMPVMAACQFNYRRQLGWPGTIVAQLYCARLGTTSVTVAHSIVDAADRNTVYCDGNTVMVWVDSASGKPVPLPAAIRRACA
ncbi:MAG: acyl-CoA thioesterase [Rudaea sp.]